MEYNHYNSKNNCTNYKILIHTNSSIIPTTSDNISKIDATTKLNGMKQYPKILIPDLIKDIIWCFFASG